MALPPATNRTPTTALARRPGCNTCSSGQLFYLNAAPRYNVAGSARDEDGATMAWMWSEDRPLLQPPPHVLEPLALRTRSPLTSPTGLRGGLRLSRSDGFLQASTAAAARARPAGQWHAQYASLPSAGFKLRNTASNQFDSRQSKGFQFRQYLEEVRSKTDAKHLGRQGAEGFRAFLKKQYGSYVVGWRALDYEKRGALSFGEFCRNCRTIGFHGNLKQIWKELDVKGVGAVTLTEVEPRSGRVLGLFQERAQSRYGSMHRMWAECIDVDNNGTVGEAEVGRAVEALGLAEEVDSKELFRMLCTGPPKAGLRLQDFDPDAARAARTGCAGPRRQ